MGPMSARVETRWIKGKGKEAIYKPCIVLGDLVLTPSLNMSAKRLNPVLRLMVDSYNESLRGGV